MRKLSGVHLDRINKREAKFRKIEGAKPPAYLDAIAAEEFKRLVPEIAANGLLNEANFQIFCSYCWQFSVMVQAIRDVKRSGMYIERGIFDKKGKKVGTEIVINPSVKVAREAALAAKNIAIEFGMTPAAATKVAAAFSDKEKPEDEDFSQFISSPPAKSGEKKADPAIQ